MTMVSQKAGQARQIVLKIRVLAAVVVGCRQTHRLLEFRPPAKLALYDAGKRLDAFGRVVQARQRCEMLAATFLKISAPWMPISSSVSMQSEENPGVITATRFTPLLARSSMTSAV